MLTDRRGLAVSCRQSPIQAQCRATMMIKTDTLTTTPQYHETQQQETKKPVSKSRAKIQRNMFLHVIYGELEILKHMDIMTMLCVTNNHMIIVTIRTMSTL